MQDVKEFRLPDLGEGLTEADLVSWTVAVGEAVELNQVIAEVETAKAIVELPSPYAGVVTELLAEPGSTIPVGTAIIRIATGAPAAEGAAQPTDEPAPAASAASAAREPQQRIPVLVGYGPGAAPESKRQRHGAAPEPGPQVPPATSAPAHPDAKPSARREARNLGVDLSQVRGTGKNGVITEADVRRHQAATPVDSGRETRTPIQSVRKQTAAAVVRSAFTAPHVTEFVTVDATASVELLARLRGTPHFADLKLTPLMLVAKALLLALKNNPSLNSTWDDERQEIVTKHYVNLGIATATPRGLMVPNIKNAHLLGLADLCLAIGDLTDKTRDGRATPAELTGGSISITNVGVFGVDTGTPILNPGEAAILCVGAIRKRPWVVEDQLAIRWLTTLSVSFDHRLVDGEQGSRFLADVADILADPVPALLAGA